MRGPLGGFEGDMAWPLNAPLPAGVGQLTQCAGLNSSSSSNVGAMEERCFGPAIVGEQRPGQESAPWVLNQFSVSNQSYQRLGRWMQDVTGDQGVLKEIIREGAGELVPPDASVSVKYAGYLEHMDQPFDTNWYRKLPRLMKLGEEITLGGMEVALLTMRKGELARFLFKPAYAYGRLGCPPLIPADATVLFEMELLDFLDSAEADKFFALPVEQQDQFPLQQVLKVAATEREFGNYLFRQHRFHDAKERYKRVTRPGKLAPVTTLEPEVASVILNRQSASPEEQERVEAAKLLVLLNLAFTYLKLERPARALVVGEQALAIDPKNPKALFRCGQACRLMTDYEQARDFLVRAQKEQPLNHDINNELKQLASSYRDYMDKKKEMCTRIFAPLNSSPEGQS
ncbi:inactive peptidyl-prolyl cis-trans isomerase FKBP6 isoform X1 [Ornithorhynchus anatinus]|uniref:inactive peptidyl-prolyl cis-trans isomerase FKBP6 isoform X1 n=1 Tax=Ornithorhynchus anatinus TaxID=9258 RepID=UPI0010A7FD44|nr:inactive peptidyl-prolyl cis-trans isomerase FKBP6 isoform X1 [Ornithorhynchus anatinus]XP_028938676.1 inactive peptidyl-prolyl cis-trans isomerase FKBP6 isoform X1 [Ornithorhynchus anatinus]XP_028938677.1 inactive peptidyl-prolyl cis-trans isomerase FKBP6 isoform X1 [Ornithorhynchus anatinus]